MSVGVWFWLYWYSFVHFSSVERGEGKKVPRWEPQNINLLVGIRVGGCACELQTWENYDLVTIGSAARGSEDVLLKHTKLWFNNTTTSVLSRLLHSFADRRGEIYCLFDSTLDITHMVCVRAHHLFSRLLPDDMREIKRKNYPPKCCAETEASGNMKNCVICLMESSASSFTANTWRKSFLLRHSKIFYALSRVPWRTFASHIIFYAFRCSRNPQSSSFTSAERDKNVTIFMSDQ